jgi:uncharacterized protein (DUF2147 family)
MMKRLFAIAAFLLASTAAQAQYTFDYNGQTIRIDPDRGTVSIPGVYDNSGRPTKRPRNNQDSNRPGKPAPDQAKVDPQTPAAAPVTAPAPGSTPPAPSNATANVAPANNPARPPPAASTPAPQVQQDATPAANPAPPPVVATAPVSPPPPAPTTTKPTNSPLGVWLTEQKEGKIRIEPCGANLCGYSVDAKSNQNRTQILIDMKPDKDSKWSGRIFDPKSGSTYDSTIALKSSDSLRVQGCAFGGMFCGGQIWSRIN